MTTESKPLTPREAIVEIYGKDVYPTLEQIIISFPPQEEVLKAGDGTTFKKKDGKTDLTAMVSRLNDAARTILYVAPFFGKGSFGCGQVPQRSLTPLLFLFYYFAIISKSLTSG